MGQCMVVQDGAMAGIPLLIRGSDKPRKYIENSSRIIKSIVVLKNADLYFYFIYLFTT